MLKFILAAVLVIGSVTANAQVNGDLNWDRDGRGGGFDRDNRDGGFDRDGRGGRRDHDDRRDHGPRADRFRWSFDQIDNNGCKRCQMRADQWETRGCRDLRAYEGQCNRRTVGMRMACRQPYTKNNDYVYTCRFVGY